jgi:octaprenyl-diphosphate synthase
MTLPVLKALKNAGTEERAFWQRCMSDLDQQEGDFAHARRLFERHNALGQSLEQARAYARKGIQLLKDLPQNALRKDLEDLIVFAVERQF